MSLLKRIGGTEGVNQTPYSPQSPAPTPPSHPSTPAPTGYTAPHSPTLAARGGAPQEELVRRAPA